MDVTTQSGGGESDSVKCIFSEFSQMTENLIRHG
jgi:hypothetical protein